MALSIGELVAYVTADNRGFRRGLRDSRSDMEGFQRDTNGRLHDLNGRFVREGEAGGRGFGRGFGKGASGSLGSAMSGVLKAVAPLAKMPLMIAAVGTTAVSVVPLLVPVVAQLIAVGQAALAAGPALLALRVAGLFVTETFKQIFAKGSAAMVALQPLADGFTKAGKAASSAAAAGIRPLAQELNRIAMPIIEAGMVRIGDAVNKVQRGFLGWAKSAAGVKAIRDFVTPIGEALNDLAPHVTNVAIEFGAMLGRIMGVSAAAGQSGLARVLDVVAEKLRGITAGSVQGGIDKLVSTFNTVAGAVRTLGRWISIAVQAYKIYQTQFSALADVIAIAAIAFGGPVAAIAGVVGLIVRHFDQLKAGYERLKLGLQSPIATDFFANLRTAAATVLPPLQRAFQQIRDAVLPVLQEIWVKIKTQLIPTLGEFIAAISPVVAWLVTVLGPVVAATFRNILSVISGAIDIIVGVFKIFIAILHGDWGKAWEGIKQILAGAWKIIVALFRQGIAIALGTFRVIDGAMRQIARRAVDSVISAFGALGRGAARAIRGGVGAIMSAIGGIKNRVVGFFAGAGRWLWGAGRAILDGLIGGVRSAIGKLKGILGGITSMIPNWKGPMTVDQALLEPSGRAVMDGFVRGIVRTTPLLRATLGEATTLVSRSIQPADMWGHGSTSLWGRAAAGWDIAHRAVTDWKRAVASPSATIPTGGGTSTSGGSGPGWVTVKFDFGPHADSDFARFMRKLVKVEGGGNVQVAFGSSVSR